MGKKKILGISGHLGSGKDLFAEMLAMISKVPVERHAFADKVRDVTELITGQKMKKIHEAGKPFYNPIYNYTQEDKNIYLPMWNKTIGQCLQLIGTDVFRNNFDEDTWVKTLFSTVGKDCIERGNLLVVTDLRFPNEASAILERGGIVIRMEGDPMDIRKNTTRDLNHPSETSLDNYDKFTKIIYNDVPGIEILQPKVQQVFDDFIK